MLFLILQLVSFYNLVFVNSHRECCQLKHLYIMVDLRVQPVLELLNLHSFIVPIAFTHKPKQSAELYLVLVNHAIVLLEI